MADVKALRERGQEMVGVVSLAGAHGYDRLYIEELRAVIDALADECERLQSIYRQNNINMPSLLNKLSESEAENSRLQRSYAGIIDGLTKEVERLQRERDAVHDEAYDEALEAALHEVQHGNPYMDMELRVRALKVRK